MLNNKTTLLGLLALMLVFGTTLPGQAAENTKAKQQPQQQSQQTKAPIVIEGDELSFSDLTGEVFAKGNVVVTQNDAQLKTDLLQGNTKQTLVWSDGPSTMLQPGVNLVGTGIHYNYQTQEGNIQQASGKVDAERVSGQNIELLQPNKIIIHNGTMTKCPAKVPDYHVSADKVEIWPGDKLIAYNAKVWIKNTIIYSTPKYQKSLKQGGAGETEFPRVGYDNDDGVSIRQYWEYPLSNNIAAFTNIDYYSKSGFKPDIGVIDREKNFSLAAVTGDYKDGDNNWIKKEPEFQFNYYSHRLSSLPVSYTFSAVYGKWVGDGKTSWHQDYNLYFSRDTIKLDDTTSLSLGAGVQQVRESYDGSQKDRYRFDGTLTKQFSPRFTAWAGYHYTKNNDSLFEYDKTDLGRELDTGFSYKIDKLNTLVFNQSYDLTNNKVYDQDYTWQRDLHCWQANITYRAKREKIQWDLSIKRW